MEEQRHRLERLERKFDSGWKMEILQIFKDYKTSFKGYELLELETEVVGIIIQ